MKKIFSREVIIGISVLIALLILFFGINYLKGINIFKAANYYYSTYTNVAGLSQSAPVTLNGFKVGLVREIEYQYDNPGHILVEMSLNRDLKVPKGTKAVLTTDFLGTSTIELQFPAGVPDYHDVGDQLEGELSPGLMEKLTGEMLPAISGILPKVDSLLATANDVISNPALKQSIDRLDVIMANLESSTSLLQKSLRPILTNATTTMDNVSEISQNLSQVSAALAVVAEDLKSMPLDSTMRNVNTIVANLERASAQLNSTNSSLGLLLNDKELYENLNNSVAHVDSILIDLKRQPKRYIPSIKIF